MKRFLFLDNFRGFSNTTVPIADVNFLVGQNSTGKTSLLNLLRMFSSATFFMGHEFSSDDVRLGHFNELVSAHSEDRRYFRIGFSDERPTGKLHGSTLTAMLFTYKEDRGLPRMSRVTLATEGTEIHLRLEDDGRVLCKKTDAPQRTSLSEVNSVIATRWAEEHAEEGRGWDKLALPEGLKAEQIPLGMILTFASQALFKRNSFGFFYPLFGPQLVWIAPIRTKPRRTYDEPSTAFSSDGSHTPYVIRRMLSSRNEAQKFGEFMTRVGKASGLFERIETTCFGAKNDSTAPFEVDAVVDGKALNLNWVGYGVSQSLPILVELLDRPRGSVFAIQQPEVHLHPRAQASLGDVFFEMAIRDKKGFLIETHSDFTIDRFRMNYRGKRKVPKGQILFFERRDKRNVVTSLPIGPKGELSPDQPDAYREFFVKEEINLLGL